MQPVPKTCPTLPLSRSPYKADNAVAAAREEADMNEAAAVEAETVLVAKKEATGPEDLLHPDEIATMHSKTMDENRINGREDMHHPRNNSSNKIIDREAEVVESTKMTVPISMAQSLRWSSRRIIGVQRKVRPPLMWRRSKSCRY